MLLEGSKAPKVYIKQRTKGEFHWLIEVVEDAFRYDLTPEKSLWSHLPATAGKSWIYHFLVLFQTTINFLIFLQVVITQYEEFFDSFRGALVIWSFYHETNKSFKMHNHEVLFTSVQSLLSFYHNMLVSFYFDHGRWIER